jgi:hypothetical protein
MCSNGKMYCEAQTEVLGKNVSSSTLSATRPTQTGLRINMDCYNKKLAVTPVTRNRLGLWQVIGHLNYVFNEEDFQ